MSPLLGGATGVVGGGRSALLALGTDRDDARGAVVAETSGVCFGGVDDGAAVVAAVRWAGAVVLRGAVESLWMEAVVAAAVALSSDRALAVDIVAAAPSEWDGVAVCDGTTDASGLAAGSGAPVQPATQMMMTAASAAVMSRRRAGGLGCCG